MKKLVNIIKNHIVYQIGPLSQAEVAQIKSDISAISGTVGTHTTEIANRYTKTETDTAISNAIAAIDKEIFIFADALPTEDIKTNKIYVVPTEGETEEKNQYTEWLYKDGTWEKVGEFKADQDLSNIYTKTETDAAIASAISGLDKQEFLTQSEYDALETKDPTTVYNIYVEED